eukprot:scaffold23831_cov127-Cylindrotheca_fusiformis.AAC.4
MASFYSAGGPGASTGGGGFYDGGGYNDQQQQQFPNQGQQQQYQQPQQYQSQQPAFSNNGMSQWQQPQQQYQQQQPQQSQGGTPFFGTPAATGGGGGLNMGGIATQAAARYMTGQGLSQDDMKQVWESGFARIIPGFDSTMQTLRTYFAVDNNYVKRKMQKYSQGPGDLHAAAYALPYSDENAPDLYVPVMSLITYSLLAALCYGTAGKFNPEVIADVTTKCFFTQLLEVALIRFGLYTMQVSVAILDLVSYTGYKYLGLTINMLFGLGLSHLGYGTSGFYVTFLWTASAAFYFMLKTMTFSIPEETAAAGPKRSFMVLGFAASQVATMWFVSQTQFL